MKNTLFIIILSLIGIISYVVFYEIIWGVWQMYSLERPIGLAWGLTVRYSLIVFSIISISLSLINVLIFKLEFIRTKFSYLISVIIFSLFFLNTFRVSPYRTWILIICAVISFLISMAIERILKNRL
jgi:hypothetical protein